MMRPSTGEGAQAAGGLGGGVGAPGVGCGRVLAHDVPRSCRSSGREVATGIMRPSSAEGAHAAGRSSGAAGCGSASLGGESYYHHQQVSQDEPRGDQAERSKARDAPSSPSASKKVTPTAIHDASFVEMTDLDVDDLAMDEPWSTDIDVSQMISTLLIQSDVPVRKFCISSSKWRDSSCLEDWMDLLSEKSVEELDILNLGHRVTSLFPLESLLSNKLRILRIGFMRLDLDLFCFKYNSLHVLDLFCCDLQSLKLSWVITDCLLLEQLKIHYCCVDLHINSDSLKYLECFGNTGNRMVVESAPKLLLVVSGLMPKQKSKIINQRIKASVTLNNVSSLKFMTSLSLSFHNITVNAKVVGSLPSLVGLNLSLEMSSAMQLQDLRQMLESFPSLESLSVVRVDPVTSDEGLDVIIYQPFQDLDTVHCVRHSLMEFSLQDFQGGPSEMHLIQFLLKTSPHLSQLSVTPSKSVEKRA